MHIKNNIAATQTIDQQNPLLFLKYFNRHRKMSIVVERNQRQNDANPQNTLSCNFSIHYGF